MPSFATFLAYALLTGFATSQTQTFVTLPNASPVTVNISVNQADETAPGYIFVTPYLEGYGYGPHIFDQNGTLVWWGNETVEYLGMDLQVCAFNGSLDTHLCYNERHPVTGNTHSASIIRVFDNTYTEILPVFGPEGDLIGPDFHELNWPLFDNGYSFIQDVYQTFEVDLSSWGGTTEGYVASGCFQEINTTTRVVLFEWCSIDYVPVNETYVYLPGSGRYSNGNSGAGTQYDPWDYFHINGVDKNTEGDYLVSARYTNAIYKIAGANSASPGSIIWHLNGAQNDFELLDGLNFSRQHTGRFIATGATETTITLFDNASDGFGQSADASSGMTITLNNATMTAYLARQYVNPDGLLAVSQGNVQTLPSSNVFIGWGQKPYYSEFTEDGTLLYHAQFAPGLDKMMSLRSWKYPWVGRPAAPPALVAYAPTCDAPVIAFVSWNGATEVLDWRFSGAASADGPWVWIADARKTGFETQVSLNNTTPAVTPWILVEALDVCGECLGKSVPMLVFVPGMALKGRCGEAGCVAGTDYGDFSDALVCDSE